VELFTIVNLLNTTYHFVNICYLPSSALLFLEGLYLNYFLYVLNVFLAGGSRVEFLNLLERSKWKYLPWFSPPPWIILFLLTFSLLSENYSKLNIVLSSSKHIFPITLLTPCSLFLPTNKFFFVPCFIVCIKRKMRLLHLLFHTGFLWGCIGHPVLLTSEKSNTAHCWDHYLFWWQITNLIKPEKISDYMTGWPVAYSPLVIRTFLISLHLYCEDSVPNNFVSDREHFQNLFRIKHWVI
jgi:hypothetical protein